MAKSRDAFRTISEVSEALDTPAHVLRFWESKFSQIKPVKRAGGRRYYRPDDISLLGGIKTLLHEQGMTIKGAQKLLREKGIKHVIAMGADMLAVVDNPADVVEHDAKETDATENVMPFAPRETKTSHESKHETQAEPVAKPEPAEPVFATAKSAVTASPAPQRTLRSPTIQAIPSLPTTMADRPARFFAAFRNADPDHIRNNADRIAPLLRRLEAARDAMRSA